MNAPRARAAEEIEDTDDVRGRAGAPPGGGDRGAVPAPAAAASGVDPAVAELFERCGLGAQCQAICEELGVEGVDDLRVLTDEDIDSSGLKVVHKRRVKMVIAEAAKPGAAAKPDAVVEPDAAAAGPAGPPEPVVAKGAVWHPTVKGVNARIDEGGRRAWRTQDWYRAIVFATTPMRSCRVRIIEQEPSWSGSLELGFSPCPPEELGFDATAGNFSGIDGSAFLCTSEHWHDRLKIGTVVEWTLEADGTVRVEVDGEVFHQEHDGKRVFPMADAKTAYPCAGVYGQTKGIELLPT